VLPGSTRPARANGSSYTIEFRRRAGWDRVIPRDAVIVHEVRSNGLSFLPTMGLDLAAGDGFVTPDPKVFVRVAAIDASLDTATVRIWDLPAGCLRKEDSKPKVYLIENNTKRWVTSPQVLTGLGKSWADVKSVPDGALTGIPDGPDVNLITVTVTPFPVVRNRAANVRFACVDSTGAPVAGQVKENGVVIGDTNQSFSHNFRPTRVRNGRNDVELVWPAVTVVVPNFPVVPVDCGFP
jgi:hypothetical protein